MSLDLRTVMWLTAFANAALTLWQLATVDRQQRRHDHGIWFLSSTTLLTLTFAGFARRDIWPDWASQWLANVALVAAGQCYQIGARSLAMRGRANARDAAAGAGYIAVFTAVYLADVSLAARATVVSAALVAWFYSAIGHLRAAPSTRSLRAVRAMVACLALAAVLLVGRVLVLLLSRTESSSIVDSSPVALATALAAFVVSLVCGVGILSVTRERGEFELLQLAAIDPLTELPNRRALFDSGARKIALHQRNGRPLTMLMVDLDHFKEINDTYGHPVGDQVLRRFAEVASATLRTSDLLTRAGGEEFCALLPETGAETAMRVAERLRTAVAGCQMVPDIPRLRITCSIGVAQWQAGETAIDPLLDRADHAMYAAKAKGRNCVVLYDQAAAAPSC